MKTIPSQIIATFADLGLHKDLLTKPADVSFEI